MNKYTPEFLEAVRHLVENYLRPELHPAMVSQWILESARGTSKLAREANNFAGMKYREALDRVAEPLMIKVPSESQAVAFAKFRGPINFVRGFWRFLDRAPYMGWREKRTPDDYIEHVGPIWATDPDYVKKVKGFLPEARRLIAQVRGVDEDEQQEEDPQWFRLYSFLNMNVIGFNGSEAVVRHVCDDTEQLAKLFFAYGVHRVHAARPEHYEAWESDGYIILPISPLDSVPEEKPDIGPGTGEPATKPAVIRKPTPNQSSRNGAQIRRIVLHYTTSSNAQGTISWFANPAARVSAHYMVGRNGELWQFVSDDRKAWHAAGNNADTIGIENVAAPGQKLTAAQEAKLIELCRWLMAEYKIGPENVTAHKWLPYSTSCPGSLWATESDLRQWIQDNLT